MLYLLRSQGYRNSTSLKVGFTSDVDKRFYQYQINNPTIAILATRPGDLELEKMIHYLLNKQGLKKYFNEWYLDEYDVFRIFHYSTKTIINKYQKLVKTDEALIKKLEKQEKISQRDSRNKLLSELLQDNSLPEILKDLVIKLSQNNNFTYNMKTVCDFISASPEFYQDNYQRLSIIIPNRILNYINQLGVARIKALRYVEFKLREELTNIENLSKLSDIIFHEFEIGKIYTLAEVKKKLQDIYDKNNIKKTAKASDLKSWFEAKSFVTSINKVNQGVIQLINKK